MMQFIEAGPGADCTGFDVWTEPPVQMKDVDFAADQVAVVLRAPKHEAPLIADTDPVKAVLDCGRANMGRIAHAMRDNRSRRRIPLFLLELHEADHDGQDDAAVWGGAQYSLEAPMGDHNEAMTAYVYARLGAVPLSAAVESIDSHNLDRTTKRQIEVRQYPLRHGWTLEKATVTLIDSENTVYDDTYVEVWACPPGMSLTDPLTQDTKGDAEQAARQAAAESGLDYDIPQD